MHRTRRRAITTLSLALLAPTAPLFSQAGSPIFAEFRSRGMPSASVSCVAQDARGFIWIGTEGGLLRYDGSSFKSFAHEPSDPESLVADSVQAIHVDRDAIWVGTREGLSRLDLRTECFASYRRGSGGAGALSSDVVTSIARDGRGALWVGTLAGLDRLEESAGGFRNFRRFRRDPSDPASLPSDSVTVLKADRAGRLWVGCAGMGLVRFDQGSGGFVRYGAGRSVLGDITAIDEEPSGKLWLGFASGGLSLLDPASGRIEERRICEEPVRSICAGMSGFVYVGTAGGGLVEYSIESREAARYRKAGVPGSLTGDDVRAVFRDRAGDLWIGAGGLCLLARPRGGVEAIWASEGGMPSGRVESILVDSRGRLWAGSGGGEVASRDPSTGAWRRFRLGSLHAVSPSDESSDFLLEDGRGVVWAGLGGSLARFDEAAARFVRVPSAADGYPFECVQAMAEDPSGGAWLGTSRSGLVYWDRASGSARRFELTSGRDEALSGAAVTALCRDAEGNLWVGSDRGLGRLRVRGSGGGPDAGPSFALYRRDPKRSGGISSDSISAILLDSRKVLWIGTRGGGLMRYEQGTDCFSTYTERDGLPDNQVRGLLEDSSGGLWISTRSAIARYDRSSGRFRRVSGFGSTELELCRGAAVARDGSLLFGAADRILRIDPKRFGFNDNRPPIVLVAARARGMPHRGAAELERLGRLELPRGEGSVSFEFSALDYREPWANFYSYRLEGFDEQWSPPGPERVASYTNLPGGSYLFRVRASNGDGLWNEEGLSLRLRVRRGAWTSPFAIVLYLIIFAGGGYAAARKALGASLSSLRAENERLHAKLVTASAAIESAAIVDGLTGLPNKRKIMEHLELAISRAAQSKLDVAVLMVDIDRFKSYNDRFGKAAGDECLKSVARAISACVRRSSDVVARFGGEEFLVVMEKTSIVGALSEAEAIRRAVEALGDVTASVGCVSAEPGAAFSTASLVADAEKALMAAKMLGRNRTSV